MLYEVIKGLRKKLDNRRKWNRTKRWMRDRAYSRAIISLYHSGVLRKGA